MVLPRVIYPKKKKKAVIDTHVAGREYSFSTGAMVQTQEQRRRNKHCAIPAPPENQYLIFSALEV